MIKDFEKSKGIIFDNRNSEHNKSISEFVDKHRKKYQKQYEEGLNDFDMEIIFIK